MNLIRQISEAAAKGLVMNGERAFVNDTPTPDKYLAYTDVCAANGIGGTDYVMSPTEVNLCGLLTFNSSTGTWPVDKRVKPFPR